MSPFSVTAPDHASPAPWRRPSRLQAYAVISAAAFIAYILGKVLDHGPWSTLFVLIGVGSCGWSWLLTRALFDPAERDAVWPRIVVGAVWLTGTVAIAAGSTPLGALADNAYALTGSAALLITFVEPLHGFRRSLPRGERAFRLIFLAGYALLVTVSILLPSAPGRMDPDAVRTLCAVGSLVAVAAAVGYRVRHPLARERVAPPRQATPEDVRLAERILDLLRAEDLHAAPDLKVAELARRLGEPEYRVTRSITAASGFANFNRLVNHHRIERAKWMLRDPALHRRPILTIAYDCGFASLGPFNRAFKAETGLTPREWRGRVGAD